MGVGDAAKSTVGGVVEAVGSVGATTVEAAKSILVGVVGGVKEVISTALPKPSAAYDEASTTFSAQAEKKAAPIKESKSKND